MKPNILPIVTLASGVFIGIVIMVIYGNAKIPNMPMVGQIFSILGLALIALSLPLWIASER